MRAFIMAVLISLGLAGLMAGAAAGHEGPYRWVPISGDPTQWALYEDGAQRGNYWADRGHYRRLIPAGGRTFWSPPCLPPCPPPRANFGMRVDRMKKSSMSPGYVFGGADVSRDTALRLIRGEGVPSSANKLWVVAAGKGCEQVLADWPRAAELRPWQDKAICRGYADVTAWQVQELKAKSDRLTVSIMASDGEELSRTEGYTGGAKALALALENAAARCRRPDASYDPSKTPDLSKPLLPRVFGSAPWSVWVVAAGLVAVAVFVWRKRS